MEMRLSSNQIHLLLVLAPMAIFVVVLIVLQVRPDPRTAAATKEDAGVEFSKLPDSGHIFRMTNSRSGVLAYFTLPSDSVLTAPVRAVPCEGFVPPWIPSYSKAEKQTCLLLKTNLRESRSLVSFLVRVEDTEEAYEFYNKTLADSAGLSGLASGVLPTARVRSRPEGEGTIGDISTHVGYTDKEGIDRASITYYRTSPDLQTVVVIEFGFF